MEKLQLTCAELSPLEASPLVSVIIDNYNYAAFLGQAIESVLSQTYKNFELIVVDDGSTDDSPEVLSAYGDRITAIFQSNAGQGEAFNRGIAHAKGQIICFLDADDYFHPDKLAKVVEAFQAHPNWVQLSHQCIAVDEAGTPIKFGSSVKSFDHGDVRNLLLRVGKYKWMRVSGRAYRREALEKVIPMVSGKADSADAFLLVTVPFYGEVGGIEDSLMFYRVHGKNRHARTTDLNHLVRGRELIAAYIDQAVAKVGIVARFNIQRDADYLTFKAIQTQSPSGLKTLKILWLTLQEMRVLKRSFKEIMTRLLWGSICILLPIEAPSVFRLGLNQYLRAKLSGKELRETTLATEKTDLRAAKP
ncbi:MAG: glycosyltransferase [Phormidesmis sp. CAN_BIN44]|nr:glycosyltransferase [Phormidesmis sp. CAN_BIN44]